MDADVTWVSLNNRVLECLVSNNEMSSKETGTVGAFGCCLAAQHPTLVAQLR